MRGPALCAIFAMLCLFTLTFGYLEVRQRDLDLNTQSMQITRHLKKDRTWLWELPDDQSRHEPAPRSLDN